MNCRNSLAVLKEYFLYLSVTLKRKTDLEQKYIKDIREKKRKAKKVVCKYPSPYYILLSALATDMTAKVRSLNIAL